LSDELLSRALALPEELRAGLAHRLLLSLEPDDFDEDSEAAWEQEIAARLQRMDEGKTTARPWREALAAIRQSLLEERQP
jgi:putative addiction module component (TIGR02574 family)